MKPIAQPEGPHPLALLPLMSELQGFIELRGDKLELRSLKFNRYSIWTNNDPGRYRENRRTDYLRVSSEVWRFFSARPQSKGLLRQHAVTFALTSAAFLSCSHSRNLSLVPSSPVKAWNSGAVTDIFSSPSPFTFQRSVGLASSTQTVLTSIARIFCRHFETTIANLSELILSTNLFHFLTSTFPWPLSQKP
jgi:hypothetical protein